LRFTFILQEMWTSWWKYGHGCYNDNISNIITNPLEMWSIDYYKKCTVLCGDSMFFIIDGKWMFAFIHTH